MKVLHIRQFIFITSITVIFTFSGCKSKKTLGEGGSLIGKAYSQVIEDVVSTQLKYTTISAKGDIGFKIGSIGHKVPAVYKLIKDSVFQISLRTPFIGNELFRIDITSDNMMIIDRKYKRYVSEDALVLAETVGLNFYNLQSLFTNQLFYPGAKQLTASSVDRFNVSLAGNQYLIQAANSTNTTYSFAIDATDHIVSTLISNKEKNVNVQWVYSDFIVDNLYVYPTTMEAKIGAMEKKMDVSIIFSKLDIDNSKGLNVDLSVSSKYAKVDLSDILSTYVSGTK